MKFLTVLYLVFIGFNSLLFTQTENTVENEKSGDSTKIWISINPLTTRMNFERNSNTLFEIDPVLFQTVMHDDSVSAWLKTKMLLNYPVFDNNKDFFTASEMTLPLYNKLMEDNKMSLFYTILGSIQTAAVGVLAYQHLKKYGFLKKKDD